MREKQRPNTEAFGQKTFFGNADISMICRRGLLAYSDDSGSKNRPQWQKVFSHFRAQFSPFFLFWVAPSISDDFGAANGPKIPRNRSILDRVR